MDTRKNAIALMCLGADVELTIVPKGGFPSVSAVVAGAPDDAEKDGEPDAMDVDDDDEPDTPLALVKQAKTAESASASRASARSGAGRKKAEDMLLTLVHGDIVLLSGDEFEVCTPSFLRAFIH